MLDRLLLKWRGMKSIEYFGLFYLTHSVYTTVIHTVTILPSIANIEACILSCIIEKHHDCHKTSMIMERFVNHKTLSTSFSSNNILRMLENESCVSYVHEDNHHESPCRCNCRFIFFEELAFTCSIAEL